MIQHLRRPRRDAGLSLCTVVLLLLVASAHAGSDSRIAAHPAAASGFVVEYAGLAAAHDRHTSPDAFQRGLDDTDGDLAQRAPDTRTGTRRPS